MQRGEKLSTDSTISRLVTRNIASMSGVAKQVDAGDDRNNDESSHHNGLGIGILQVKEGT